MHVCVSDHPVESPIDIFSLLLSIEETPLDVEHARTRAMLIGRLVSVRYTVCMTDMYKEVPFHFLVGCFYVNFRYFINPYLM